MPVLEALIGLIGPIPETTFGMIAWAISAIVLLYLVSCAFAIIGSLVKMATGGK